MAEAKRLESNPEPEADAAAQPKRSSRKGLFIGMIAVAVALGGVAGSQLIVPQLFGGGSGGTGSGEAPGSLAASHPEERPPGTIYQIENIIVNPAGEEGNRFLMATVAFEVPMPEHEEHLREQDVRVRDRVLSILENQTMEMLTRPGARDSLKRQLADAIWPMVADAEWMGVYLPQFVIQ
jgi:flagellar FliL protein